jgi:hypothetical protein
MSRLWSEALCLHLERAKLLGVPTIDGGSAWPGGGGVGSQRSQISLPSHMECTKTAPNWPVSHIFLLKNGGFWI